MISIFAKLPFEIINIILEDHSGILHREKMIELKKELKKEGIIKLLERTKSFEFKETWGYNEAERIISFFQNCQCCERHQKLRPSLLDLANGFVPEYSTKLHKYHLCNCPCRHICRYLCREINDEEIDNWGNWADIWGDWDEEMSRLWAEAVSSSSLESS